MCAWLGFLRNDDAEVGCELAGFVRVITTKRSTSDCGL